MAEISLGTLLYVGTTSGSTTTYAAIAEVTDINAPSLSRDTIDITSHSSGSGVRDFLPGLTDGGEVTLTVNYEPANATHITVVGGFATTTIHKYRIVYPWATAGQGWYFSGFTTKFSAKSPIDDKLSADITIKVTGLPVYGTMPT